MDCHCAVTLKQIIRRANVLRKKRGVPTFNYQQGRLVWHRAISSYKGKRNPFLPHNKIGVSYIFTTHVAKKIIANMVEADYNFMPGHDPWKNYYANAA